ncbi:MAG: hypothetical protein U1E81_07310 [Xanthobacteraceae bacterium]
MSDNAPRDDDEEDEGERRTTNIVIGIFVVAVIGIGIWLVNALLEQRRLDDCAAQGRRSCAAVTIPSSQ